MIRPSSFHSSLWLVLLHEKRPRQLPGRLTVPVLELDPKKWPEFQSQGNNPRMQRKGKSGEIPR